MQQYNHDATHHPKGFVTKIQMCNLMCKERRKAWCAMIKRMWTQYILTMVCGYALIVLIDVGSTCTSYHKGQWCKKLK